VASAEIPVSDSELRHNDRRNTCASSGEYDVNDSADAKVHPRRHDLLSAEDSMTHPLIIYDGDDLRRTRRQLRHNDRGARRQLA
jgi:hypothetical protein